MKRELQLRKKSTTCEEPARRSLDISRDEYALCSYIQYRQAYADQKKRGFCCDDKAEIAFFVGISRAGLYKMIDRMAAKRLLESEAGSGFLSVTNHWIDTESGCKQSRQLKNGGVNKVDSTCKQSRQHGVNLVTRNIEVELELELEQLEKEKEGQPEKTADGLALKPSLEDEKGKKRTPIPPPPFDLTECFAKFSDPEKAKALWLRWTKYRKDIKHAIKTEDQAMTALRQLWRWTKGDYPACLEIVEKSIGSGWRGLIEPEKKNAHFAPPKTTYTAPTQKQKTPAYVP